MAYRAGASAELGSSGAPGTFGTARTEEGVRIVWHYQALDERRTFSVGYRLRGLAVAYDDVVDVNLQVWGPEWEVGLARLTTEEILPGRASGPEYRVFGHPVWVRGDVRRLPQRVLLRAQDVPPRQFVELRVVFPRSLLTSTAGARVVPGDGLPRILAEERADAASYDRDRERIRNALDHIGRTILVLLALAVGPALLLVAGTWLVFGRERSAGYDREYEQAPPSELAPALVPALLRQGGQAGSNEFTATLFDLIRRGRFETIPVTTSRSTWGGLRHEDVADLELSVGDGLADIAAFEKPVERVVDGGPRERARAAVALPRPDRGGSDGERQALRHVQGARRLGGEGRALVR